VLCSGVPDTWALHIQAHLSVAQLQATELQRIPFRLRVRHRQGRRRERRRRHPAGMRGPRLLVRESRAGAHRPRRGRQLVTPVPGDRAYSYCSENRTGAFFPAGAARAVAIPIRRIGGTCTCTWVVVRASTRRGQGWTRSRQRKWIRALAWALFGFLGVS